MVVIAQTLSSTVLSRTCTVPQSYLIAKFVGDEAMHLETEVEACTDAWCNSIEGVGQDG